MKKNFKKTLLSSLVIGSIFLSSHISPVSAGRIKPLGAKNINIKNEEITKSKQESMKDKEKKTGIISLKEKDEENSKLTKSGMVIYDEKLDQKEKKTNLNTIKTYRRKKMSISKFSPVKTLNKYEQMQEKYLSKYINKEGPISPIDMSQKNVQISSHFGIRKAPNQWASTFHKGIDIAAPIGTLIYSPLDGEIVMVKHTGTGGNTIKIKHSEGKESVFMHMSMRAVNIGDKVKRGDIIGTVGNTGNSTGSHLHYEFRHNGVAINPINIIMN